MTLFQTTLSPNRRAAARFIAMVRRALQKALIEEGKKRGLTQSDIARELNVHRSVINRELRGEADIGLGRIGEFARVLNRKPIFELQEKVPHIGQNVAQSYLKLPSPKPVSDATSGSVSPIPTPQPNKQLVTA